jgi:hypothetical protein
MRDGEAAVIISTSKLTPNEWIFFSFSRKVGNGIHFDELR